ncbi:unnamed protein product [Bursaphelenchus xylophilus]|uniref:(pine wood nematode) hypothetical protein n=1 Tax=Bursaphelenchus xylophilus TaxID=6326 RepID=A0A1I7RIB7_BURXY|nr:unnamed protein product [Bursaphelenchus xylophilus]CAG9115013.1 unnamed protein product [Bursaphelenchus xylophilus]
MSVMERKVDVACCGGTVKDVVTRIGVIGIVFSLISMLALLTGDPSSGGNVFYFIFCILLIYGANSNKPGYFWPFLIYNAILIVLNILATIMLLALLIAVANHNHRDSAGTAAFVFFVTIVMTLVACLNIFFEHVVYRCYRTATSNDNEFNSV